MPKRLLILASAIAAAAGASNVALASSAEEGASTGEPHYVPLDTIEVPIVGSDRIEGSLRVKLVLDASDAGSADALAGRVPQLRAAAVAAAMEFSHLYASGLTPVDAQLLRSTLTAALKRQDPDVARVLVVEVAAEAA